MPPAADRVYVPPFWFRHRLAVIVMLSLAVAGVLCRGLGSPGAFDDDYARFNNKVFTVSRVVDGDTFDFDVPDGFQSTTRVRLWGVDTPETVSPLHPPMYFGAEACEFTKQELLGKDVLVELSPIKTRDRYWRLLAYVYPVGGDASFNQRLIETGHAYADSRFDHPRKLRFQQLERKARSNKIGLWAAITEDQMPEWRQRMERWAGRKERP